MTHLEIVRRFDPSPDRIWRAFTEPTELASWFWPHLDNEVEIDLRVGGGYRIAAPTAGMAATGEYREIAPPTRLVFSWRWAGEAGVPTLVTVELAAAGAGTRLTLVHDRFPDDASRDQHIQGWQDCLDRLDRLTT